MCVSPRVASWLRDHGHDAAHLDERGLARVDDGEVFRVAAEERRIVGTFDLDFAEILATGGGKSSVIVLRLADVSVATMIRRPSEVLGKSSAELERGAILMVEAGRHRIRRLPIER
jgi:predicted nuclease of predicted toxin-antitoxin system